MKSFSRPLLAGILAFALVLFLAPAGEAGKADVKAPNFRTKDMNGDKVVLEDLLGKGPILIDFWATWCKPCIKELPYVQRLHDEYAEKGLTVLAVTIDSPKSQSRVKPFIKGRKFTFPVILDGSQDVFRKLQGKGTIPYVVVLDAGGTIRYRHTGYRPGDEKELEKIVLQLFEEAEAEAEAKEPDEAALDEAALEESTG